MTASDPLPWTLDRLAPKLYSAGWPDQPLTAQVSIHAEAVTGEWTFGVINQEPRFVPFEGDEGDPGKAVPDDRSYTLTLAPGGRYRLELTAGEDPGLTPRDEDEDEPGGEDDDGTDPWASAVTIDDSPDDPAAGTTWRGYCGDGTSHWVVYGDRAERTAEPGLPPSIRAMLYPSWLVSG